jgi:hypothetical protein
MIKSMDVFDDNLIELINKKKLSLNEYRVFEED